jgi:hypothetical protein
VKSGEEDWLEVLNRLRRRAHLLWTNSLLLLPRNEVSIFASCSFASEHALTIEQRILARADGYDLRWRRRRGGSSR